MQFADVDYTVMGLLSHRKFIIRVQTFSKTAVYSIIVAIIQYYNYEMWFKQRIIYPFSRSINVLYTSKY